DVAPIVQAIEPAEQRLAQSLVQDRLALVLKFALAIDPDPRLAETFDHLRGDRHGLTALRQRGPAGPGPPCDPCSTASLSSDARAPAARRRSARGDVPAR